MTGATPDDRGNVTTRGTSRELHTGLRTHNTSATRASPAQEHERRSATCPACQRSARHWERGTEVLTLPHTMEALRGYELRLTLRSTIPSAKSSGPLAIAPTKRTGCAVPGTERARADAVVGRASLESTGRGLASDWRMCQMPHLSWLNASGGSVRAGAACETDVR